MVLSNSFTLTSYGKLKSRVGLIRVFGLIRYFKEHGWPSSTIFEKPPEDDEERAKLIDTLQVSFFLYLV